MTEKAKQVTMDLVKALARHGPWGAVVAALLMLLMNPQIMAAAVDGVAGRTDKKIEAAEYRAVAVAKAYTDEKTNAVSHDVAAIKEKIANLENSVKESLAEQKQTNRQVGELVGELRAMRRGP